jgi:arabinose-5-phosphate isomerase
MQNQKLNFFTQTVQDEVTEYLQRLDEKSLNEAANLINQSKGAGNRCHITGIGKPSHVAEYLAALLSSTGTPTYFLDATEAVHGSAGQVMKGDVVIAISNSGQTAELRNTIEALKKIGIRLIAVTGNSSSYLATAADVCLLAGVDQEGDDFNKPPRLSILAEIIALQSLSILLQEDSHLDMKKYYLWHPGGALGASIKNA